MILTSKVKNLETNKKDVAVYFKPGVWHLDLVAPFLCEDIPSQTHGLYATGSRIDPSAWPFYIGIDSASILDYFLLLTALSSSQNILP